MLGCNCAGEPCEVRVSSSTALDEFLLQDITTLPTGCSSGPSAEHGRAMPVVHPEEKPGVCAGCGGRIVDRYYLLAVDKQWHLHCLKCCECKLRLESELTCFAKDGSIYCKQDYYRRFSVKRCARCHLGISASEMVMRARDLVFHLNCFMCETCNRPLTTGDQYGMRGDTVYCRYDYETLVHGEASHLPLGAACSPPQTPTSPTGAQFYNGVGAIHKGRPRKRKSPEPNGYMQGDNDSDTSSHNDGYQQGGNSPGHQPQRQKRMRTSFKHHQLRAMKSYFALNHNPDAKDLKQLAQKTGLTKRVLQVWFQNARAKYRRNLLRQQSDSQSSQNAQKDPSITELPASTPALGNVVSPTSRSSNNNTGGQPKHSSSNMQDMSPTAHAPSVGMECHVSLASSMTSSDGHMQPLTHLDMTHAHSPSLSALSPPNSAGLSTHAQSFLQEIGRELPQTTM
ncbi:LIM/homeobox protein Lhx9-like isoform X1 [Branchiostoma floridae]|uniref:LIM class homeodomain transcription factor, apterous subclass n=2 Tax=Branchiostoma floridae TaxID=7739 RepID=C3ZG21_BRAFL|nr:LIM/homeobox protein Lhx9-like isoform X1 [Branchiostoma floridae]|eukprot:XP_002592485.1 LIM class homeodomain transcription factor, apterous subclass [Branchiostoma floridae]